MRRVGGESAHGLEGVLQPSDHLIERLDQPSQLVLGLRYGKTPAQVRRLDLACKARDLVHRSEGPTGYPLPPATLDEEGERHEGEERPPQRPERLMDVAKRVHDPH